MPGPLLIGACVGGCALVGQMMRRRGPRGRRRRGFLFFRRRRPLVRYVDRYGERYGWRPADDELGHIRTLVRQYANLFCRAHPPCTRSRILADPWARGYVSRQVAVAMTGQTAGARFEGLAHFTDINLERFL